MVVVPSAGGGWLRLWQVSSHEVVQMQVNIGAVPICCCRQQKTLPRKVQASDVSGELQRSRSARPTLHFG